MTINDLGYSESLDEGAYDNFQKMERKKLPFSTDAQERKQKDKAFWKDNQAGN